ncbi:hypothetical protein UFOVP1483_42 [uncultured Caudovirales phage]|uniref:Uncharacterized protein n=1 Tax=uncultured Caudovirales phage TaxID=2100421 RepID=A0A6J5SME0_9CAUD|nr:hypothetical protein UFOVP1483_42 [uncultured Caudovirales phage]
MKPIKKSPGAPRKEPTAVISKRVPAQFKIDYEARVNVAISNLIKQWRNGCL